MGVLAVKFVFPLFRYFPRPEAEAKEKAAPVEKPRAARLFFQTSSAGRVWSVWQPARGYVDCVPGYPTKPRIIVNKHGFHFVTSPPVGADLVLWFRAYDECKRHNRTVAQKLKEAEGVVYVKPGQSLRVEVRA